MAVRKLILQPRPLLGSLGTDTPSKFLAAASFSLGSLSVLLPMTYSGLLQSSLCTIHAWILDTSRFAQVLPPGQITERFAQPILCQGEHVLTQLVCVYSTWAAVDAMNLAFSADGNKAKDTCFQSFILLTASCLPRGFYGFQLSLSICIINMNVTHHGRSLF